MVVLRRRRSFAFFYTHTILGLLLVLGNMEFATFGFAYFNALLVIDEFVGVTIS